MDKFVHLILLSALLSIQGNLSTSEALSGTATQSSTYDTWAAQRAIDGVRYGDASTFCSFTSSESNSWWRLDLLDVYNISTVIISARSDCCTDQANGAEIRIGNSLENNGNNNPICAVTSGLQRGYTITYSCGVMEGRYVNVIRSGRTSHLSLCEVEVYGTENLALKGNATQSSTYEVYVAKRAIDGVRYENTYAYTGHQTQPWWRLDLLDIYNITTVIITGYTSGADIRIGNSLENNGNNNSICTVRSVVGGGGTVTYSCNGMMGRYLNLVKSGSAYLLIYEVEVYGTENVALKGTATQSSTYDTWAAEHAVDGVRNGDGSKHCSFTSSESDPWWRLDLLDIYNISTVIITARPDCCLEQTNGAEIRIGNSQENNGNNNPICAVTSGLQRGYTISFSCGVMEGRYVNVIRSGSTGYLSLCEVEVYGTENLALKGNATQSSTYEVYVATRAIDGVRYENTYAYTGHQTQPWWRLDLLDIYNIATVIITGYTSGADIRIGNSLENNGNNNPICTVTSVVGGGGTVTYSCNGMMGRYLNLVKSGSAYLLIYEVEVYGTDNLAFRGTVTQSSTHLTWSPQHAIDGVKLGTDIASYCSITANESNPWWRMDLYDIYEINTVVIRPRSDFLAYTSGAEIRIGNSLENNGNNNPICAVTSDPLTGYTVSFSCGEIEGRYVNVFMSGRTSVLALCEVEVYGIARTIKKTFLRLKFSSGGDVAAESDKILHQLQSALGLNISDFKLSWTQLPKKEEEQEEDGGSCVKHL